MKIVLATRNKKKIEEIRRVLPSDTISLLSLDDFPLCPETVEDGQTFQENAEKKAREVAKFTGHLALADDSGLVVDSLGGQPGVYSARYAGPNATDQQNLDHLLQTIQQKSEQRLHQEPQQTIDTTPHKKTTGRFECVLTLAEPSGRSCSFSGSVEGTIIDQPQGKNGFGYDPIFVPIGLEQTFAQISPEKKDAMSHRGRALAAFSEKLKRSKGTLFL